MVWIGSHNLQKGSARYMGIVYVVPYPEYEVRNGFYKKDLALLKLKKKIDFLKIKDASPVSLPSSTDTFGPSSECWITGWGNIQTGGTYCTYSNL